MNLLIHSDVHKTSNKMNKRGGKRKKNGSSKEITIVNSTKPDGTPEISKTQIVGIFYMDKNLNNLGFYITFHN